MKLDTTFSTRTMLPTLYQSRSIVLVCLTLLLSVVLAACDNGPDPVPTAEPSQPTSAAIARDMPDSRGGQTAISTLPAPQISPESEVTPVDAAQVTAEATPDQSVARPTAVTARGNGVERTAMGAYPHLRTIALDWQPDLRLALLVNSRPGQQSKLLSVAQSDRNVFEATPGGLARNWTLVAVSPSRGAVAVSSGGEVFDLMTDGAVTGEMIAGFSDPALSGLELASLDAARIRDSDAIWSGAGEEVSSRGVSIALLNPAGLGLGPLGASGGEPLLVYQLFSVQPERQVFALFDAMNGNALLMDPTP